MKREVIAFIGRQGSGKSYQSKTLVKERGFKKLSFADPLREIAFNVIGMNFKEGMKQYDELKRTNIINGLNFRNILENLGASVRKFDKDFWANALVSKIKECADNIVIDDMRYPNEYEILRNYCSNHGILFKAFFCNYKSEVYDENNQHESAGLSNYLANVGYEDLQLISLKDVLNYSVIIGDYQKATSTIDDSKMKAGNIKQQGEQLITALKGLGK